MTPRYAGLRFGYRGDTPSGAFTLAVVVFFLMLGAMALVGCVVADAPAPPPPSRHVTIPAASPPSRTTTCGAGKCGESWVEVPEIVPSAASR